MRTATCSTTRTVVADPALDDALDRIAQLTARLHAVADLHGPRRTLLGGRVCRSCAQAFPCPTAQASGTPRGREHRTRGTRRG